MKAKHYLAQAYRMNLKINNQLEQLQYLRVLTTKITSTLSEDRVSCTRDKNPMESSIIRVLSAEEEINAMIDSFVDLKTEISNNIQKVDNFDYKLLLELRYLCFNTWEDISLKMHYKTSYIYKMHNRALNALEKIINATGGKK